MADALMLRVQAVLAGRFAVEREIGRGGMGIVYLARDLALDRPVAVKVLAPAWADRPDLRARFLHEARLAARLSHPNIVPVHAVEEHGPIVLFVMAYVEGETVGSRVRRAGPLGSEEAARVLQDAAWALGYAHRLGIVHRDVKPENVFLEKGTGRALVLDFGIAEVARAGPARGAAPMGTLRYMSPEQLEGRPLDGRSDLYSLGVTGYFVLRGRHLVDAPRGLPVQASPGGAESALRGLPPRLGGILERCLAPVPDDRFASGEELASALGDARGDRRPVPEPVRRFVELLDTLGLEVSSYLAIVLVLGASAAVLTNVSAAALLEVFVSAVFIMAGLFVLRSTQLLRQAGRLLNEGLGALDVRRALADRTAAAPGPTTGLGFRLASLGVGIGWIFAAHWWDGSSHGLLVDGLLFAVLTLVPVALLRRLIASLWMPRRPGRWSRLWWRVLEWKVLGWAALGRKRPVPPALIEDRTELALDAHAKALFDALPRELQSRFDELPRLLTRLAEQVTLIRAQGLAPRGEPLRAGLMALESMRLRLLELGAGNGSEPDLTASIEAAEAVCRRIEALVEQRELGAGSPAVDHLAPDTPT